MDPYAPKFFRESADLPTHSSGSAQAGSGDGMTAASDQTFQERYRIDQNRKHIKKYRDSFVARGSHLREELNRRLNGEDEDGVQGVIRRPINRQAFNAQQGAPAQKEKPATPPRQQFREPPSRGYNPFA